MKWWRHIFLHQAHSICVRAGLLSTSPPKISPPYARRSCLPCGHTQCAALYQARPFGGFVRCAGPGLGQTWFSGRSTEGQRVRSIPFCVLLRALDCTCSAPFPSLCKGKETEMPWLLSTWRDGCIVFLREICFLSSGCIPHLAFFLQTLDNPQIAG